MIGKDRIDPSVRLEQAERGERVVKQAPVSTPCLGNEDPSFRAARSGQGTHSTRLQRTLYYCQYRLFTQSRLFAGQFAVYLPHSHRTRTGT